MNFKVLTLCVSKVNSVRWIQGEHRGYSSCCQTPKIYLFFPYFKVDISGTYVLRCNWLSVSCSINFLTHFNWCKTFLTYLKFCIIKIQNFSNSSNCASLFLVSFLKLLLILFFFLHCIMGSSVFAKKKHSNSCSKRFYLLFFLILKIENALQ